MNKLERIFMFTLVTLATSCITPSLKAAEELIVAKDKASSQQAPQH